MARFRKKPVEIEALQWRVVNHEEVKAFLGDAYVTHMDKYSGRGAQIQIRTLEGPLYASEGDWIVRGVAGEFYPVKPVIFEATYERAES